jgi:hypothetical protein
MRRGRNPAPFFRGACHLGADRARMRAAAEVPSSERSHSVMGLRTADIKIFLRSSPSLISAPLWVVERQLAQVGEHPPGLLQAGRGQSLTPSLFARPGSSSVLGAASR